METPANSSFSARLPGLQLGIDSTSLGAFKRCPRYYQLGILEGWRPASPAGFPDEWSPAVDPQFGIWMHEGRERYEDLRARGVEHEEALVEVLHWLMLATWNNGRPWASGDGIKNRFTLVRTLVWYLDHWQSDPLETVKLASGTPAIEHSFRFPSGWKTRGGEDWLLCGHLDKVGSFQGSWWISDLKTTRSQLGKWYFESFTPDNQFSLYIFAGQVIFPFKVRGLMLDAVQVLASGARFERVPIQRTQAELAEWHRGLGWWLARMEDCAEAGEWPMNDRSCFRCDFRGVCSKGNPVAREEELKRGFRRRQWDPLQARRE